MAVGTIGAQGASLASPSLARVIAASAAGTAFEWYDFFVFVPLATIIAKQFSAGLTDSAAFLFALGSFAVGFAFRPVGALVFGRIGDRRGRKGAFIITVSLMGGATFCIGLLPSYGQLSAVSPALGVVSPILFVALRMAQGIALGGEYGGAAIYVAEHAPARRRGYATSWIQTSAAVGLCAALLVTLAARTATGEAAFAAWGWRLPFLASAGLLAISLWIRLSLAESPAFERLEAQGGRSAAPFRDAFADLPNLRRVLIALFSMMVAQGAVWYCAFFYAQVFIEKVIHVQPALVNLMTLAIVVVSAPLYVLFGWLSDRIGRKWVMTLGTLLTTAAIVPGFHLITAYANPALARAQASTPVTVLADPATCSLQFDPVGKAQFRTGCDIAKGALTAAGVSYSNLPAPLGAGARVRVGAEAIASPDGAALARPALARLKAATGARIGAALHAAGYPASADPARTNVAAVIAVLLVFTVGACALYGPQAACLVELFPTRVRYTSLSLPYHVGTGWVGGFLPATAYAMVVASGNIYFGLWYPVVGGALAVVVFVLFLPETRGRDLDAVA